MILPVRVGSRGELQLPRRLLLELGLKPNQKVICTVEEGKIVIKPVTTIEDVILESTSPLQLPIISQINKMVSKR